MKNCRYEYTESRTDSLLVRYFALTDSTNKEARLYVERGEYAVHLPVLFIADAQTSGRGRMGRSFYSPADTGLYMTLLLQAPEDGTFSLLTSLTAVAASDAIDELFGIEVKIKWVNDLYLGGRKVAGILAESFTADTRRFVAVGIGINLSTERFPEDIADKAGALCIGDGVKLKNELAVLICKNLLAFLGGETAQGMQKYRERSCVIGRMIRFTRGGESLRGEAVDIQNDGSLAVKLTSGEHILLSTGEISVFADDGREW